MDDLSIFLLDLGLRSLIVDDMKAKFYVVYESYAEHNQFEGSWDLQIIDFPTLKEADDWMKTSWEADACRRYKAKLIGPLALAAGPTVCKARTLTEK